jgi:hypothetical protein
MHLIWNAVLKNTKILIISIHLLFVFFGFCFFFLLRSFIGGVVVECLTTHITLCTQPAITRRTIPFHARIPKFPLMLIRTTLAH